MKKILCAIICSLVLSTAFSMLLGKTAVADTPVSQNQGQNKTTIRPGEAISLYAQGRDADGLDWAWLSTNETGEWQSFMGWWNFDWHYSKKITINHNLVEENLTNFPLLITNTSLDFLHAQPDGDDFVFVGSTNTTPYAHEIESYNSTTGELLAWVKIPFLSRTMDTVLYMYYGNPTCESQEDVKGTWSNGYLMVHHMTGANYTDLKDSTSDHWNVTSEGGHPHYNVTGKIGTCVGFNSSDDIDYLKISKFRLPSGGSYTGSTWVTIDNFYTERTLFEGDGDDAISLSTIGIDSRKFKAVADTDQGYASVNSTTPLVKYKWYYVCTRVDSTNDSLDLFVDGFHEGHNALTGVVVPESSGLNIGVNKTENKEMYGKIDELRISNVPRSNAWIKTEYTMMTAQSAFFSIGNEQNPGDSKTYGSPIKLQGSSQWQWSNFTWQNPTIIDGRLIGWRIYYQDTQKTIGTTGIKSYTIVENPPNTPEAPRGLTTGYTEIEYPFIIDGVTDPDGDSVAYWIDWGDGTTSGWTELLPSGSTINASHIWQSEGLFYLKVKAKDIYGSESSWSYETAISIAPSPLPQLSVVAPSSVVEGNMFDVLVEAAGVPLDNATVTFAGATYHTNTDGIAHLVAPSVGDDTPYAVMARHDGYRPMTVSLLIVNQEEEQPETGWIYGTLSDSSGKPLQGVLISVRIPGTTPLTTVTDDDGYYYILVPVGTYTVDVSKQGYTPRSESGVTVQNNKTVDVNFILEKTAPSKPPQTENKDLMEAVIAMGISNEKVGGVIDCQLANQWYNITVHKKNLTVELLSINQSEISLKLAGEKLPGTIIVLRLFSQSDITDVTVTYDEAAIEQVNLSDIFSLGGNETEAKYTRILTEDETGKIIYCLVYVPHFSEHEITISTIKEVVEKIGGIIAVVAYVAIGIVVAAVFLYPVFSGTIIYKRKKDK